MNEAIYKVLASQKLEPAKYDSVEYLPTGSLMLDAATGGGYPRGRFTLMQGAESTGKTSLGIIAAERTIADGGSVVYFDVEHAFDPNWGYKFGLADPEKFVLVQPETAEQCLETMRRLIQLGSIDLIILDSIAALTPRAMREGTMDDNHVAIRARLLSQFYPIAAGELGATNTAVLQINQSRVAIGQWAPSGQIPETFPGGKAKDFFCSLRMKMWVSKEYMVNGVKVGQIHRGKITKNKTASTNGNEWEVPVRHAPSYKVDRSYELFSLGKAFGILRNRAGEPYKSGVAILGNEELGKSMAEIQMTLDNNQNLAGLLEEMVREYIARIA